VSSASGQVLLIMSVNGLNAFNIVGHHKFLMYICFGYYKFYFTLDVTEDNEHKM